jgi:hypothetical protein
MLLESARISSVLVVGAKTLLLCQFQDAIDGVNAVRFQAGARGAVAQVGVSRVS